ncbi:MAG: universal stress protein [Gammaproteobacteria bacterium]|nr:MAG: universal stress protein [Gammaproteobacteria bacterium]
MSYKNVLVAVDLTEESDQVLVKAQHIAERDGAKLALVHVVKPIEHVYGGFGAVGLAGDFSAQMATLEQQAVSHAQEQLAKMGKDIGVDKDRLFVPVGSASREIHRLAKEEGIDLIVIGSHGRHGLGLLLGSTANGVLHGASCDVLAVRVALEN